MDKKVSSESVFKDIRRRTRKKFLRREDSPLLMASEERTVFPVCAVEKVFPPN